MGASVSRNEFTFANSDEPHATRRKLILDKYPQVKKLMGVDQSFKWQVVGLTMFQLVSIFLLRNVHHFWLLFALAYCVGGVANHALMLAIHEIAHNMAFGPARPLANRILGIFANLPIGLPMSISFKKYHLEHHRYQGDELLDTDIPTYFEVSMFNSTLKKLIWCLLQPFFYTMRPLFVHPKPLEPLELTNVIVQLTFDAMVVYFLGWHLLAYLLGGSILAMGLHPVAGHFISEHTLMFDDIVSDTKQCPQTNGRALCDSKQTSDPNNNLNNKNSTVIGDAQLVSTGPNASCNTITNEGVFLVPETCSYYGPLNRLTFNVGYHVEHHDFPSIPGSRLHKLSEIAPEFYRTLNYHTSWTYVLWNYITNPKIGPSARVRRHHNVRLDNLKRDE